MKPMQSILNSDNLTLFLNVYAARTLKQIWLILLCLFIFLRKHLESNWKGSYVRWHPIEFHDHLQTCIRTEKYGWKTTYFSTMCPNQTQHDNFPVTSYFSVHNKSKIAAWISKITANQKIFIKIYSCRPMYIWGNRDTLLFKGLG